MDLFMYAYIEPQNSEQTLVRESTKASLHKIQYTAYIVTYCIIKQFVVICSIEHNPLERAYIEIEKLLTFLSASSCVERIERLLPRPSASNFGERDLAFLCVNVLQPSHFHVLKKFKSKFGREQDGNNGLQLLISDSSGLTAKFPGISRRNML